MKRLLITIAVYYAQLMSSFSQDLSASDTANYQERKLKLEEVNFVSGYYQQDGNHSGVTGGIGTEKLTDFANTLDLKISKTNEKGNIHQLFFEMGIDIYTSASSANIRLPSPGYEMSGPSHQDTRLYPSLAYSIENPNKGNVKGIGLSYSQEYDYVSRGIHLNFAKTSKDKNRELGVGLFAYFDEWMVIYPYELRPPGYDNGTDDDENDSIGASVEPRNSFQASFTFSQVINNRLQLALLFDPAYQEGQLTTLYQRVYFTDQSVRVEKLPDKRTKIPVAIRANYFLGDRIILRSYYRYYQDDWGNRAHTVNLETPFKVTPLFSLIPFYRYSKQTGIDYFAPYGEHQLQENFYSSDYDLAPFTSHFFGMGIRIVPVRGVFGVRNWNSIELRAGHYVRSPDLAGNSVTLALKFR